MQNIAPFLMFSGAQHGKAAEAVDFYVGLLPRSRIIDIDLYGQDDPIGVAGTVRLGRFSIDGLEVKAHDSSYEHKFSFTPSMSLFVEVDSEPDFERIYAALSDGGKLLLPADDYGFSRRFAWVDDRYGVSWQVNLA